MATSPRKRQRVDHPHPFEATRAVHSHASATHNLPADDDLPADDEDTDIKLATLASLHAGVDETTLLEALIAADGSIQRASQSLAVWDAPEASSVRSPRRTIGRQSSLHAFSVPPPLGKSLQSNQISPTTNLTTSRPSKPLTRRGQTLHLYAPEDIAAHTPCSLIHDFLPAAEADQLLRELLDEAPTFQRQTFKIFDNVVQSPHSACFYVGSLEERRRQQTEYLYNGRALTDVREITPQMRAVAPEVRAAVNREIQTRIRDFYPEGRKLRHQSPDEWLPNAAFVNCYDGAQESVGYHADQLTYLGPRAVIGSISLGVAREFRVRKIVARGEDKDEEEEQHNADSSHSKSRTRADREGQIAIHLPHNSLLVMHAEMQEEWKHSIAPATAIDPHPIAGGKRINITYRHYKEAFHPKYTPRCRCNIATVLRCVQRRKGTRGRYMWMCHAGNAAGQTGCSFFQWAEFDEDGRPPWQSATAAQSEPQSGQSVSESAVQSAPESTEPSAPESTEPSVPESTMQSAPQPRIPSIAPSVTHSAPESAERTSKSTAQAL